MNCYEITFLVEDKKNAEEFTSLVTTSNGSITKEDYMGEKLLAYPIDKKTKAHYYTIQIEIQKADLEELKKKLQFNPIVMRYLILARDEEPTQKKPAKPKKTKSKK